MPESKVEIGQPKHIKVMSKSKEQLINNVNKKLSAQLAKVKDGSTMICVAKLVTTTKNF